VVNTAKFEASTTQWREPTKKQENKTRDDEDDEAAEDKTYDR